MGPQQKEFHREILRTEQVGVRSPNKKNFTEKFYGQSKLGFGAPTKRISPRNSTDRASWGSGPNKKNFTEKFHGQGKFGRTRWDTVFKTDSVSHFFCFITCKVKLMLSQIQVLKYYELLVVYVTKITTTLMLLLQILQSI